MANPSIAIRTLFSALLAGLLTTGALLGSAAPAYADNIRDAQWHLAALRLAEAHQRTQGDGIVVAVIDAGVDESHPDLAGNVLPAVGDNGEGGVFDPDGHGTALAGAVVAHGHGEGTGREAGVLGVAPGARVLPVLVRRDFVPGSSARTVAADQLAAAIELATQRGARVICIGYQMTVSDRLREALATARRADAIVVALGSGRSGEASPRPSVTSDGVLVAVPLARDGTAPTDPAGGRSGGLAVPGMQIMTTNTQGGYRIDDGTAAPGILAGAVALVRAAYPKLPADEVIHRLSVTAVDAGDKGADPVYGLGTVNLVAALTRTVALLHPPAPSAAPSSPGPAVGDPPAAALPRERGPLGWLVALPLLVVLGVLVGYAVRGERRAAARSTRAG